MVEDKNNILMNKILLDKTLEEFDKHLENNPRTIVSAKFGDGKTTFLREYMQKRSDQYLFIRICPVNYAVASNEDVFEYLKRDILKELCVYNLVNEHVLQNIVSSIANVPNAIAALDFITNVLTIKGLSSETNGFLTQCYTTFNERYKSLKKYNEFFAEQRGGIYEKDGYTQMICESLKYVSTREENPKKTVLIIDDLDRIDPAHLFRILNVLAAHIDNEEQNKFGFHNIIIVLDYDVTEQVFKHFYGKNANYSGYMHKFISSHVYRFSIQEVAQQQFVDFLKGSCHVSDEILDTTLYDRKDDEEEIIEHVTMKSFVSQMSVRDVARVLDNVGNNIIDGIVHLDSGKIIEAKNNVTLFLSALIHMNVKYNVENFISNLPYSKETLEFLGDFLLATPDLHRTAIRTNKGLIAIKSKKKLTWDTAEIFETIESAPIYVSTKEVVYNALKAALKCVAECPQLSPQSFTKKDIKDEAILMEKYIGTFKDLDEVIDEIEEEV